MSPAALGQVKTSDDFHNQTLARMISTVAMGLLKPCSPTKNAIGAAQPEPMRKFPRL
jgi:hypothetical protein